ncbi:MAG TPA: glutathione ABC transporter substrate-binding protein [Sporosarcina sp.]|nr:glutathione ABC transporter substrate-binding protein [Sporosarcina sp.]
MKKQQVFMVSVFAMLLFVLTACASGSDPDEGKDSSSDGGASDGTKDFVIAVHSDASTLDPTGSNDVPSHNMQEPIFERLLKRDENMELIPGLAKEWEFVDDTTVEFILEENVTFHDGEPFNAEAVKKSLDRVLDPKVASPKYDNFAMIESVDVVDEFTVQVKTSYPFAPILAHLSHTGASIISPKLIDEDYKAIEEGKEPGAVISDNPIGTGPFKYEEWTPGEEITFVRNEDYWGEKAVLDTVTMKVSPESGTRLADLERGFVHATDPVLPNEVAQINDGDFAEVLETSSTGLAFIGFNMKDGPFEDIRVRQAVSMALNKDEVIDGVYDGFGVKGKGPLAPKVFGYDEEIDGLQYDLEEAKKLLAEAGYEDGFTATLWTNDNPQRIDTAILLQDALKDLNIELKIEQMEFGTYIEELKKGDHDLYMLGWTNPMLDADHGLYMLFHSSSIGVPPNAMWYENDKVDELLEAGRQEMDDEKRLDIYKELQETIIEDAPMIFLDYQVYLTAVRNNVEGFRIDSGGIYHLEKVDMTE